MLRLPEFEVRMWWVTHWGWDKMTAFLQTTFSHTFSWMKIVVFLFEFHWNLFPGILLINRPALKQMMACYRVGTKPLSGTKLVRLLTHICVTRPRWVNPSSAGSVSTLGHQVIRSSHCLQISSDLTAINKNRVDQRVRHIYSHIYVAIHGSISCLGIGWRQSKWPVKSRNTSSVNTFPLNTKIVTVTNVVG